MVKRLLCLFVLMLLVSVGGCAKETLQQPFNEDLRDAYQMIEPQEWYNLAVDEGFPYAPVSAICPHIFKNNMEFWSEAYDPVRDADMQSACEEGVNKYISDSKELGIHTTPDGQMILFRVR